MRELDLTALVAVVEPFARRLVHAGQEGDDDQHRRARSARALRLGLELHFGEIEVTEQVVAYERKTVSSQERIELVPLDARTARRSRPRRSGSSRTRSSCAGLETLPALLGTLHAAEHALISLLPLWAMCDRWDIGGLSTNVHPETGRPTVFIYDGHPGGVGITERGFDEFEGWVRDTAALLRGCPCTSGCPSCVQSPKCGNLNEMLDKAGALTFLSRLVDFGSARSSFPRHTSKGGSA